MERARRVVPPDTPAVTGRAGELDPIADARAGPFEGGPGVGSAHEAVQVGEAPTALPVPWKPNSTDCPAATCPL